MSLLNIGDIVVLDRSGSGVGVVVDTVPLTNPEFVTIHWEPLLAFKRTEHAVDEVIALEGRA